MSINIMWEIFIPKGEVATKQVKEWYGMCQYYTGIYMIPHTDLPALHNVVTKVSQNLPDDNGLVNIELNDLGENPLRVFGNVDEAMILEAIRNYSEFYDDCIITKKENNADWFDRYLKQIEKVNAEVKKDREKRQKKKINKV